MLAWLFSLLLAFMAGMCVMGLIMGTYLGTRGIGSKGDE